MKEQIEFAVEHQDLAKRGPLAKLSFNKKEEETVQLRLLIACFDPVEARGLLDGILAARRGTIVGEAEEISAAVHRTMQTQPDVLLLESRCCDPVWRDVLLHLSELSRGTQVLLLCEEYTSTMLLDFVSRGVSGCLARHTDFALLAKAVATVHEGQAWFDRAALVQAIRWQPCDSYCPLHKPGDDIRLTSREGEIMRYVGVGLSNKEIATALHISVNTVQTVLHRIYTKLQVSGRYKAFAAVWPQDAAPCHGAPLGRANGKVYV